MEYTKIKKIHVAEAGTLSTLLPMEEAEQLEVLILSGYLNAKDFFDVLDDLCDFWGMEYDEDDNPIFDWDETPNLRVLDMGDCELVDSTTLPEFGYYAPLDKIVLPKNLEYLVYESVIHESFLREIVLPQTMKSLDGISSCERLEHIEIPESVEVLGMYTLSGCPKIKEFYIPKNVRNIHGGLLAGNKLIKEITVSEENQHFVSIDGVVYTRDLKTLVAYPGGSGRKVYRVLEGTEELGMGAFMESDIEEIILPESLKSIGEECFSLCLKLRQLIMPDSVTKLGRSSFAYCHFLENLHLSTSLKAIEHKTFGGCVSLKRLDVPGSVKTIDASAIVWNEEGFEEIILHEGVEEITAENGKNSFMFAKQSVLRKIYIPSTLKYLTTGIFSNCMDLESLVIAENNPYFKTVDGVIYTRDGKELVAVPDRSREDFSIAEGTEIIGEGCFWQFCRLRNIHIPSTVRIIESRAFDSCMSLKEISLPESLEEIGTRTFDTCDRLKTIMLFAKQPPKISGDENHNLISFCNHEVDILVPAESVNLYLSDPKWSKWNIKAMA